MAITHVSTSSSSTQGAGGVDNESLTFSLSSGTGRKIFVRFGMDQTTPFGDVESVTFDGQACTLVGGARLDNGSFETTCFLYYYDVPDETSSGNKTAAVTFTDTTVDIALVVSEFTGIALGDASSTDFDEVTSGNTSCALTAPTGNSIGVDVAAANVIANLTVAGTDQVERVEVDVDDYTLSTSETAFSTSGAKTMVWSYSTGGRRVQVAGLWAEAATEEFAEASASVESTVTPAAALVATGSLTGSTEATVTPSASLTGAAGVSGSTTVDATSAASLAGTGGLSAAERSDLELDALLTAHAALAAALALSLDVAAELTGMGDLSASTESTIDGSGTLSGGDISGSATLDLETSAALTATGALSASVSIDITATAGASQQGEQSQAIDGTVTVLRAATASSITRNSRGLTVIRQPRGVGVTSG